MCSFLLLLEHSLKETGWVRQVVIPSSRPEEGDREEKDKPMLFELSWFRVRTQQTSSHMVWVTSLKESEQARLGSGGTQLDPSTQVAEGGRVLGQPGLQREF